MTNYEHIKDFRQIRNDKIFSVITDGASNTIEI